MKYISVTLALLLTLALAACGQSPSTGEGGGVAVVDMNTLQNQSRVILEATKHLETVKQSLLTEALATEQAYQNDPTPENDQIRQQAVAGLQESFGQAQQVLFTELREKMDSVLEAYRVDHGLSLIVIKDTVLAMDPKVDATPDILAAFDALAIDWNALIPITEAAAETATPDATQDTTPDEAVAPEPAAEDLPAETETAVEAAPETAPESAAEPATEPEAEAPGQQ